VKKFLEPEPYSKNKVETAFDVIQHLRNQCQDGKSIIGTVRINNKDVKEFLEMI